MLSKRMLVFLVSIISLLYANAQSAKTDSATAASALKSLLAICKNVDFSDPNTAKPGMFYKAAPYIIYQGKDKKRAWKGFANYNNAEDKKGVDEVCTRINETVNRDDDYKIEKYLTQKESEGLWHVLVVSYTKKGTEKKAAFAFLKIGKRFGLGDID